MQKLRLLPLGLLSLSMGLMSACDSTSSNGKAPTISSPIIAKDASGNTIDAGTTLTTSTTGHLTGTVTDVASWIWVVKNAGGTPVDTLVPSHSPAGSGDTKLGTGSVVLISFTPTAKWGPTGVYTIIGTLTGTSGGTTTTPAITFNAIPGGSVGTPLNDVSSVDLGAQGAAAGSFLSIEGGWSITSGQKTAADEDSIDVVFFAQPSSSSGTPMFFSPAAANSAGLGNLSGWSTLHNTIIVSSPNALTTLAQVKALTDASASQSATVSSGGWYAIKLDSGKYGAINVTSFNPAGNAATATVEVFN